MIAHIINLLLGVWLFLAPAVLKYSDPTAIRSDVWSATALVSFTALSIIAFARFLYATTFVGAWLMCVPWITGYGFGGDMRATLNSVVVGALVVAVSLLEARADERRTFKRVIV